MNLDRVYQKLYKTGKKIKETIQDHPYVTTFVGFVGFVAISAYYNKPPTIENANNYPPKLDTLRALALQLNAEYQDEPTVTNTDIYITLHGMGDSDWLSGGKAIGPGGLISNRLFGTSLAIFDEDAVDQIVKQIEAGNHTIHILGFSLGVPRVANFLNLLDERGIDSNRIGSIVMVDGPTELISKLDALVLVKKHCEKIWYCREKNDNYANNNPILGCLFGNNNILSTNKDHNINDPNNEFNSHMNLFMEIYTNPKIITGELE